MSSLSQPQDDPALPEMLRGVAKALDQLGVLVLRLASAAEESARAGEADPLLTVAEAAADLRCSQSHIRAACARGQLAAMPGPWRIRLSALRAYERRRTRQRAGGRAEGAAA